MVNCSFCGVEIKRLVFCKPSHKVMFHRKHKEIGIMYEMTNIKPPIFERGLKTCKHGSMMGLCKFSSCNG